MSDRRRTWLVLGIFWIAFGLIFPTLFLTNNGPHVNANLDLENFEQTLLFIVIPFCIVGILCLSVFLRSKRVEFYEDHVTVFTSLIGRKRDFPYSEIQLGKEKVRVEMKRFSNHFKISLSMKERNFLGM